MVSNQITVIILSHFFLIFSFQFIFYSSELTEMIGDLFITVDMPEPPKESFFKGLFGGGSRSLDREELCMCINLHLLIFFRVI